MFVEEVVERSGRLNWHRALTGRVQGRDQTESILRRTKGERTPKDSALGQIYGYPHGTAPYTNAELYILFLCFPPFHSVSLPFVFVLYFCFQSLICVYFILLL